MSMCVVINPQNISTIPAATISGLMVLYGRMIPRSDAVFPSTRLARALSMSGSLPSHSGYLLVTVGIFAKLYSGGGLGIVHSSVPAPHGSAPASAPFLRLLKKLKMKIVIANGKIIAPALDIAL